MASGAKYFIVNRESDWKDRSVLNNISFRDDCLISRSNGENGIYISGQFDSGQSETVWHRLRLDSDVPGGGVLKLRLYASDSVEAFLPSKNGVLEVNFDEYMKRQDIDINRKVDAFDYIGANVYENPTDVLMFDIKGRYLWACIELVNYDRQKTRIKSMKIEFPRVSFVDYLPEVYKESIEQDSFLERFIGIFQSIYVDIEDKIDQTPIKFDAEITSKEFLDWLSDWISIQDPAIWGEKKLRRLVKEAVKIYKMKGTKRAVSKIVQEYTGIEPIIVEQFDVRHNEYYDRCKNHIENLFGNNGYVFSVILSDKYVSDSESYIELLRIINSVVPIDSICNLVVLSDKIYLDHHCYMGMNSYIARNREIVLDDKKQDPNTLFLVNSDKNT